jgi:hypothetical protein
LGSLGYSMNSFPDPRLLRERVADANAWGIPLRDRIELEVISRASVKTCAQRTGKQWRELEFRSEVAEKLVTNGLEKKADRYMGCSSRVVVLRCKGSVPHDFYAHNRCDLRFCPLCATRQFCRLRAKNEPVLKHIQANPRRGFGLREITLTSTNTGGLEHTQVLLMSRHVKNTLRRLMRGVKGWGAIAVLEVGFNNSNLHAHILAWCPYIEQRELASVWKDISGHQVVWIAQARHEGVAALGYLLKYVSKPPADIPELVGQLEIAFHRARRIHSYGLFYNFARGRSHTECSEWSSCPRCGAGLERALGIWDLYDMPHQGLEFIGNVRRSTENKKWPN